MTSGVEWANHQLTSLNFVGNWLIFTIESLNLKIFSSETYHLVCIAIAKSLLNLAKGTMAFILWQDVVTDCVRP